jgi:HIRAN domain
MIRHYFTKVAGISHDNSDRTSRQMIIGKCGKHEPLQLIPDPENRHDPDAIKVSRSNGEQIGFIAAGENSRMKRERPGTSHHAFIAEMTGGVQGKSTLGVNLLVIVCDTPAKDEKIQEYIRDFVAERTTRVLWSRVVIALAIVVLAMWGLLKLIKR